MSETIRPGDKVKVELSTSRSTIIRVFTVTAVNPDGTYAGWIKVNGRICQYLAMAESKFVR